MHAESADGGLALHQPAQQLQHGGALGGIARGFVVKTVIVVDQDRAGIGRGCEPIRHVQILRPEQFQPGSLAQSVVAAVGRMDGFVYDVPGMHAAFVAAHDCANVLFQKMARVLFGDGGGKPSRQLLMPDQRVAAHFHVVPRGEIGEEVALREIEALRLGMNGAELEGIFGNQDAALFGEVSGVIGIALQSADIGSSAIQQTALRGVCP